MAKSKKETKEDFKLNEALENVNIYLKEGLEKYIYDNVENQWQEFDLNQDGLISWDEYRNVTYGTYLGKGQGVSLVETMVLSQRNKWVKQ